MTASELFIINTSSQIHRCSHITLAGKKDGGTKATGQVNVSDKFDWVTAVPSRPSRRNVTCLWYSQHLLAEDCKLIATAIYCRKDDSDDIK